LAYYSEGNAMAILNLYDLQKHSDNERYELPAINVQSLSVLKGVVAWAKKSDVPFVVTIDGDEIKNGLIPSIEEVLRSENVASSILARRVVSKEQAVEALRKGCQAIYVNNNCSEETQLEITTLATACGVTGKGDKLTKSDYLEIDEGVELSSVARMIGQANSWKELDAAIISAVTDVMSEKYSQLSAKGKGLDAMRQCKRYTPIEHLIIYNSSLNEEQTRKAVERGREVLNNIPGVRATWSGESVVENAKYRWCWLIRFANESVIPFYRDHPDHVAYANEQFRPMADDRISIDYMLEGPEDEISTTDARP
jgi:hypothetical protein